MSKITFDTDDYYNDDALEEMIEQETRYEIRRYVVDIFGLGKGIDNLIYNVATQEVHNLLDEMVPDYKDKAKQKVLDAIDELQKYDLFYHTNEFTQIINETVEEVRPMIQEKAKQIALKTIADRVNAEQIIDYVCDEFYNIVSTQLKLNG